MLNVGRVVLCKLVDVEWLGGESYYQKTYSKKNFYFIILGIKERKKNTICITLPGGCLLNLVSDCRNVGFEARAQIGVTSLND